jgi:glycosyltransferase involved in cell wall biosynthesis
VPYFAAPLRASRPVVVTIHDLIPLLVPTNRGGRAVQQYMRLASAGAQRAAAVIADSLHTERDIVKHLGILPARITTIHLAADPSFGPRDATEIDTVRERFRIQRPYAYYIGGFQAHKNLPMLIDAFAAAIRDLPERPLLVIGGRQPPSDDKIFPDINRAILESGMAGDTSLLGQVSDEENAALMAGCSVFLCPSRYEGFGLPPLEAMTCGAPVIASSTTSVGEVVGDGGLLVDPDDRQGWADTIRRVLTGADLAGDLRRRALQRAGQFSWAKTAAETVAVYDKTARR